MARVNKVNFIYESLKEQIVSGALQSDKMLTEADLAARYNVSRSTAKKALLMLEGDGLLVIEKNKSARLYDVSLEEVSSYLELRAVLEGYIVQNAVATITAADIEKMGELLEVMTEHINNKELLAYVKCNQEFHNVIFEACTNPTAIKMVLQLKNLLRKYNAKTILVPGRDKSSLAEHVQIFEAIKEHDAKKANEKMQQHILNLKKTFEDNVELLC
ncbi:MAG: GntR family transcriptional regulator [Enterocloster asparagiformis]|nr:GntR family transcriptional regulator [Enterocloster asparagiformis]